MSGKGFRDFETMAESKQRIPDRLSQLPDNVIDHIMSFLREEDIVSTAVSSKSWWRVRSTHHPVLNLNELTFAHKHRNLTYDQCLVKFIHFVKQTLQKFRKSKVHLQKFSLVMFSAYRIHFNVFDDWIRFGLKNNVFELSLRFYTPQIYGLPQILFSSKSLTVLRLVRCELSDQNFSDKTKCESLRELILIEVNISENVFQCLVNSFPCITNFVLKWCEGVKHLNLSSLNELNNVEVHGNSYYNGRSYKFDGIDIEALASLRSFKFFGDNYVCDINLDGCINLEVLRMDRVVLQNLFCQELASNFPLLKTFCLCECNNLGRIMIESQGLESLTLLRVKDIVDATIDTPNLRSFEYYGDLDKLFRFSIYAPRLCEATITHFNSNLKTPLFFANLRELIGKLSPSRILSLFISSKETFDLEELGKIQIPQPRHVKHLKLSLHQIPLSTYTCLPSSAYTGLVDGILWSCHPESLSIVTGHKANNDFIKALYDEVRESRRMQNCCMSSHIKCWRHDLKDCEMEGFSGSSYKGTLAPKQDINFKFTW